MRKTTSSNGQRPLPAPCATNNTILENELFAGGFESGPSRPPTPQGVGFPANCAEVVKGIYRSSFPLPIHLSSIAQLNLRTIVTLVDENWSPEYKRFVENNGITSHIIPILANKDPKVYTEQSVVVEVLKILLDPANHPVLVHCNKGRHRTGCIIACFRKALGWSSLAILSEYLYYASPKARLLDRNYILDFDATVLDDIVKEVGAKNWLPTITPPPTSVDDGDGENYSVKGNVKPKSKSESAPPSAFGANMEQIHRANTM